MSLDSAYKTNTDRNILINELGFSEEFVDWIEEENWESFDGLDRFINTKTMNVKSLKNLYNDYKGE